MFDEYRRLHEIAVTPEADRSWLATLFFSRRVRAYDVAMSREFGAHLPVRTVIGAGAQFGHYFHGIFITGRAIIGDNVTIYQHVTIGESGGKRQNANAPLIGNGVLIGANATIIGACIIGDGVKIGAGVTLVDAEVPAGATIVNKSAYDLTNKRFVRE